MSAEPDIHLDRFSAIALAEACKEATISVEVAVGRCQTLIVSRKRRRVMAILRARRWTKTKIGLVLNRDRSTVYQGLATYDEEVAAFSQDGERSS